MLEEIIYANRTIIYKEGDNSYYIYFLKEGQVELSKLIYDDEEEEDIYRSTEVSHKKIDNNNGE